MRAQPCPQRWYPSVRLKDTHDYKFVQLCERKNKEINKIHTFDANSSSRRAYNKFIALQSLWPQTIMCLISFTTQPSSKAAGSHIVNSSTKCCEWGIMLPAFLTGKDKQLTAKLLKINFDSTIAKRKNSFCMGYQQGS